MNDWFEEKTEITPDVLRARIALICKKGSTSDLNDKCPKAKQLMGVENALEMGFVIRALEFAKTVADCIDVSLLSSPSISTDRGDDDDAQVLMTETGSYHDINAMTLPSPDILVGTLW